MTPSLAALALPAAFGGVVVSTGGQNRAQVPAHLLALGVSAVKAYRVAVTCRNPAVMARKRFLYYSVGRQKVEAASGAVVVR